MTTCPSWLRTIVAAGVGTVAWIMLNAVPLYTLELSADGRRLQQRASYGWPIRALHYEWHDDFTEMSLDHYQYWPGGELRVSGTRINLAATGLCVLTLAALQWVCVSISRRRFQFSTRAIFVGIAMIGIYLATFNAVLIGRREDARLARFYRDKQHLHIVFGRTQGPLAHLFRRDLILPDRQPPWGAVAYPMGHDDPDVTRLIRHVCESDDGPVYVSIHSVDSYRPPDLSSLAHCECLEGLNISGMSLGAPELHVLRKLQSVRVLRLRSTGVDDSLADALEGLSQLVALDVRDTQIGDRCASAALSLTRLRTLDVANTRVSESGLLDGNRLHTITVLSVEGTEVGPNLLRGLEASHQIEFLNVARTAIDGSDLHIVSSCRNLRELIVDEKQVASGHDAINALPCLRYLGIVATRSPQDLLRLVHRPGLQCLAIEAVTPDGMEEISRPSVEPGALAEFLERHPYCIVAVMVARYASDNWEIIGTGEDVGSDGCHIGAEMKVEFY
jgi:hypothetical protein